MFTVDAIHPVSDFSRKPAEHIRRLKETGRPEILTVNGKAEIVIQDAKAYEKMANLLDSMRHIKIAAEAFDNGEGIPIEEAFAKLDERIKAKYKT